MAPSIPHRRVTEDGQHPCNNTITSLGLLPLAYHNDKRLPYPNNAPPSCNEIYDCDLVSSDPTRAYRMPHASPKETPGKASSNATVQDDIPTEPLHRSEAKKQFWLFLLRENSPLDTLDKYMDRLCFDRVPQVIQMEKGGKLLNYALVHSGERHDIYEIICHLSDLDDYVCEFVRAPQYDLP